MENASNIYSSLKDYKLDFDKNLIEYFQIYTDSSNIDFVSQQKKDYAVYLNNVEYLQIDQEYFIKANILGVGISDEIQEYIKYNNEIDEVKRKNLELSFKAILEFLEEKFNKYHDNIDGTYNVYPSIFEDGAFDIFKKWMKISKDQDDKKLSFIFQKLKSKKQLRKTNFKELLSWAKDFDFIDNETFEDMIIVGSFHSPSKILTKGRNELFRSIEVK